MVRKSIDKSSLKCSPGPEAQASENGDDVYVCTLEKIEKLSPKNDGLAYSKCGIYKNHHFKQSQEYMNLTTPSLRNVLLKGLLQQNI